MGITQILNFPGVGGGYLTVQEAKHQTIALIINPFVNQSEAIEERKKGVGNNGVTIKTAAWYICILQRVGLGVCTFNTQ